MMQEIRWSLPMYEHHKQPLASRKTFARRLTLNVLVAAGILLSHWELACSDII
jgi:hypothetical protein